MKTKTFSKGFTLIELTISVGIAALLATGVMAGKGFINASHTTRQGQAVERVRMVATDFLMQKATQLDPRTLEEFELIEELVNRQLIPDAPWKLGEVSLDKIQFDARTGLLMVVTSGPANQLNTLTDYHTNHTFFENNALPALRCAQSHRPIRRRGISSIKLCFNTSLEL